MFFRIKKEDNAVLDRTHMAGYAELMRSYPLAHKDFLASFELFLKLWQIKNASLFFYEDKAKLFVLKKWVGNKPARFAISDTYELIKYIKAKRSPLIKRDFIDSAHDLRQPALFFFQQTSSTHVLPIVHTDQWRGLLMLDLSEVPEATLVFLQEAASLYAHELANWCDFQDLWQSHQKLAEISHIKNQLLSNVSHELQTPLNGILGITEAILDGSDGEITEPVQTHVKMVREAGQNLHATINNFLQLIQLEARKSETKHEKMNICTLITEVVSLYQDNFARRNLQIKIPDLQKAIYVFVEPDQIRTVLMNLFSNAYKFTESGEVSLQMKKSGEMLHVTVSDTGIGIASDKLDLIFEEFYQGDGGHTRVYGGTGLGLAIAKKIISQHGGRIWASANGHRGTSFVFTIPLCPGV